MVLRRVVRNNVSLVRMPIKSSVVQPVQRVVRSNLNQQQHETLGAVEEGSLSFTDVASSSFVSPSDSTTLGYLWIANLVLAQIFQIFEVQRLYVASQAERGLPRF